MGWKDGVIGLAELCRRPVPPTIIAGLLPTKGFMLLLGKPGAGKTFFTLEIATAIATRTPAWGAYPTTARPRVLYVASDSPGYDVAAQARKLLAGRKVHPNSLLPGEEYGHEMKEVVDWTEEGPVTVTHEVEAIVVLEDPGKLFSDDRTAAEFAEWVRAEQFGVVVLDTLLSLHSADENDNSEMQAVMDRLKLVRDHALVIGIHHLAKGGGTGVDRARGSGNIAGTVDGILELSPKGERVRVWVQKQRSIKLEPFDYTLSGGDDEMVMELAGEEKPDELTMALLGAVPGEGGIGLSKLVETVTRVKQPTLVPSAAVSATWRRLKMLERKGLVVKVEKRYRRVVKN